MIEKVKLNNNQLKILALVAMTCDHVGKFIFPEVIILQIIGRLAFPIFAFMIAEGCTYTRNMKKYLGLTALVAFLCQVVYFVTMRMLYMCVLVTFSLSIILIAIIKKAKVQENVKVKAVWWSAFALSLAVIFVMCEIVPYLPGAEAFYIDYGFIGVIFPVVVYCYGGKLEKYRLLFTLLMCALLGNYLGGIQWYGMLAVIPLALYNGKRGKMNLKYLFYIYYPLHMGVIYLISCFG